MMRALHSSDVGFDEQLDAVLAERQAEAVAVEETVQQIISHVRQRGDDALLEYTFEFDHVDLSREELEVPRERWEDAYRKVPAEALAALERAAERIESFHRKELINSWFDLEEGVVRGQLIRPLRRAGVYVPGGTAAYPSSLLMNVIPAKVAGVSEVIVVTPPSHEGVNPLVLAAARVVGVDRVLRCGGAQALAALAYGTATVPQVDVVVGPGNIYVATAKRLLFGVVGVDMVAGPSEILVVWDGSAPAEYVAADLLSQAEHDALAWCILVAASDAPVEQVADAVASLAETLPRRDIVTASLRNHGLIVTVRDVAEALQVANRIAPEHLELLVEDPFHVLAGVAHAGTVLLGPFTPEAVGDYVGGPNHVLPTGGTARFSSPLGVEHFLKRTNILSFSGQTLRTLGDDVIRLARLESLEAHARAVQIRNKEG
jgi:histidinol dehydrogenase